MAWPHFPFCLLEPIGFSFLPGHVEEPGLEQALKIKSSLTLSPHSYMFVATSTEHILEQKIDERCQLGQGTCFILEVFVIQNLVIFEDNKADT